MNAHLVRFKFLHFTFRAYFVSRKFYTWTCFLFFPLRHVRKQKCNDLGKHKLYLAKILKSLKTKKKNENYSIWWIFPQFNYISIYNPAFEDRTTYVSSRSAQIKFV